MVKPGARGALILTASLVGLASLVLPTLAAPPKCAGKTATIVGTSGADVLFGTSDVDVIVGMSGNDLIRGLGGRDLICAGPGDDHANGGPGAGYLEGGSGDDILVAGTLEHSMAGNRGDDIFFTAGSTGGRVDGDDGTDWMSFVDRPCGSGVRVDLTEHRARYGSCTGSSQGSWAVRGIERVEGSERSDSLVGNDWRNGFFGQGGPDELLGKGGDDLLHGGGDRDVGRGNLGRDRCRSVEKRYSCERI